MRNQFIIAAALAALPEALRRSGTPEAAADQAIAVAEVLARKLEISDDDFYPTPLSYSATVESFAGITQTGSIDPVAPVAPAVPGAPVPSAKPGSGDGDGEGA